MLQWQELNGHGVEFTEPNGAVQSSDSDLTEKDWEVKSRKLKEFVLWGKNVFFSF